MANQLRGLLKLFGLRLGKVTTPGIPPKANRKTTILYDTDKYKSRNRIERMFNKLKNWRRVATRYDKTATSFLGFITIAAIHQWLPAFVHET